jgi:UDP-3-O-[3-hydroxymyristoyl] N-acetylglucosamine deacetylase
MLINKFQHTIAQSFSLAGVGLHSGAVTTVTIHPAPCDRGRYFMIDGVEVPAGCASVAATLLSTELQNNNKTVRTVEHLLAALVGMQIDNVRIEVEGSELPILDGSALPWAQAIAQAGIKTQAAMGQELKLLLQPICIYKGDSFVMAMPSDRLRFSYGIDFSSLAIAQQWFSWQPDLSNFAQEFSQQIAPARTFTMAKDVEYLRSQGLIKGGSLENAIVCDEQKWLNPPLRFENEPCRHKLLDLIGDLSLLGWLPQAHIVAFKASHSLHTQLAQALSKISN